MPAVADTNGQTLYVVWTFCKALTRNILDEETYSASVSFPETRLVVWLGGGKNSFSRESSMSHGHRSGPRQKVNAAAFPLRRMPSRVLTGRQFPVLKHSQSAASDAWSLKNKGKQSHSLCPPSSRSSLVLTSAKVLGWNLQGWWLAPAAWPAPTGHLVAQSGPTSSCLGDKTFPEEVAVRDQLSS